MVVKNTLLEFAHARTRSALKRGLHFVEGTAFWTAIVLPFSYIPVMYTGINSLSGLVAFVGLIGLNVVAFAIGFGHRNVGIDNDDHDPERAAESPRSDRPTISIDR